MSTIDKVRFWIDSNSQVFISYLVPFFGLAEFEVFTFIRRVVKGSRRALSWLEYTSNESTSKEIKVVTRLNVFKFLLDSKELVHSFWVKRQTDFKGTTSRYFESFHRQTKSWLKCCETLK